MIYVKLSTKFNLLKNGGQITNLAALTLHWSENITVKAAAYKKRGEDKKQEILKETKKAEEKKQLGMGAQGDTATTKTASDERGVCSTEERLGILHELIVSWDDDDSFIWDRDAEEGSYFLRVVNEIRQFTEDLKDGEEELLCYAQTMLQMSMSRLEDEFVNLLYQYRQPVESSRMSFNSTEDDSPNHSLSLSSSFGEEPIQGKIQSNSSRSSEDFAIDLIHPGAISELKSMAEMMILSKYDKECCQAYIAVRNDAMNECLSSLRMERISIEEVIQMEWCALNTLIKKWNRALKIFVRVYLAGERRLCDQIFGDISESMEDYCFLESTKGPILQFLNLGVAIAISPPKVEKIFRVLDMYEGLSDLFIDIKSLYPGECGSSILAECNEVLLTLGECVRRTFAEFKNAIKMNTSTTPLVGGGVHPLTKYVMNYIRALAEYRETLNLLLKSKDEDCLAHHLQSVTSILEANLNARSLLYNDTALQNIYLMNNLCYMVQKVQDSELGEILGDDWVRAYSRKFRQHAMNYERETWSSVLSHLKHEGLSSHGSSSVSQNLLKERFRGFNQAFEEVYRVQTAWIIPNPELRDDLKISISVKVLQGYRTFMGKYASHLYEVRHRYSYLKYCPEDLEKCLLDLFEGVPKVMHPHKR